MMHHGQQVTHLDLYNAYLIARADEMRLEAETEQVAERVGFKHPEHNAAECRDEEASYRMYDLIDKIIDTPAMTPSDLYVQAQVLADLMVRHGTYDSGNPDARIVRTLVAGLTRLALVRPAASDNRDVVLEALELQYENVRDEWKLILDQQPEGDDPPDEVDTKLATRSADILKAAAAVPASSMAGVGVKARLLTCPGMRESMHPALEQSLRDDISRLAAGDGDGRDDLADRLL